MTRLGFLGCVLVYAALAVGGWLGALLGGGGLAALLAAGYSRKDGLLLLGPFARWELVRSARVSWLHLWRSLIGLASLAAVYMMVLLAVEPGGTLDQRELARVGGKAFETVGVLTLILAGFFAAFFLPGVIAEEREKNRLDHLFVTDLRNRELLIGKVAGRLAVLAGYAVVPLPVLALLTLIGGADPFTLAVFGGMGLAGLAAFAGVAVACSALSRKSSTAVILAGAVAGLLYWYGHLPGELELLVRRIPAGAAASLPEWANTIRLGVADALRFLGGGSPAVAIERIDTAVILGTIDRETWPIIRTYLAGMWLVLVVSWWIASRYLRKPPRPVGSAGGTKGFRAFLALPPSRPPVSDQPIVWYDLSTPLSVFDRVGRKLKLGIWWVPAVLVGVLVVCFHLVATDDWRDEYRDAVRSSGGLAFLLVSVPVAWAGARGVVREKERDTLDALLLTSLSAAEIVRQKWLAAALSARGRVLAAAVFWFGGAVGNADVIGAAAALTVVTCAHAALFAAVGVWMSVRAKSGNKAFLSLVVAYVAWTIGSCLLAGCGGMATAVVHPVLGMIVSGLVGVINPLVTQVAAGYIGKEAGQASGVFDLVLVGLSAGGAAASAGATYFFLQDARGQFTRKHRPRPKRRD